MKHHPFSAAWVVTTLLFLLLLPHFIPKDSPSWWVMQPPDHQRESSIFSGLQLPFWKYPPEDTLIFQSNADLTKPGVQTIQINAGLHGFNCKDLTSQPCHEVQVEVTSQAHTSRVTFANQAAYRVTKLCGTGNSTVSNYLCTHAFSAWGVFVALALLTFTFATLNGHKSHLTSALRILMLALAWTTAGYALEVLSERQSLQQIGWGIHFSGIILTNLAFMNLALKFGEIKRLKKTITLILVVCALVTLFVYLAVPHHLVFGTNHQEVGLPYQPLHVEYKLLHAIFDNASNGFMLFMLMFTFRYWSLLHPSQRRQAVTLTLCAALPTSLAGIVWIFGWGAEKTGQDVAFLVRVLGTVMLLSVLIRKTGINLTPPQSTLKLTSPHPTLVFNFRTQHLLNMNSSAKLLLDLPIQEPSTHPFRHFLLAKPTSIAELASHPMLQTLLENLKHNRLELQVQQETLKGFRIVASHHDEVTVLELVDQSHLHDLLTTAGSAWAFHQRIKFFPEQTANFAVLVIRIRAFDQLVSASYETAKNALQHVASLTSNVMHSLEKPEAPHFSAEPSVFVMRPALSVVPQPASWWAAVQRELRDVFISEVSPQSQVLESKHLPWSTSHFFSRPPSDFEFFRSFGNDFIVLLGKCGHLRAFEVATLIREHTFDHPLKMEDRLLNLELTIGVAASDVHEIPTGKGPLEGLHLLATEVLDLQAKVSGVYFSPIGFWSDFVEVNTSFD